jgi:ornithine carbamoyltransferase
MGQEKEKKRRLRAFRKYQINGTLLGKAAPEAVVMHCLPAHRGEEITAEVIDGPQSLILDQAENRLHLQKALLVKYLGRKK